MPGPLRSARRVWQAAARPPAWRPARRADVAALEDAILGFAAIAQSLGDLLVEAEINPLFVLTEGSGVRAADGLAILK
ncbi:hypothetical protein CAL14_03805 [Bordetella genomosp. 9]|uniref:hypothetical protein n=1 Tax=Bordetella genomosp. 9 TaxID=1416803 RepID=UPI000A28E2AC|nr:hypothetical protein [Bordetella genomosp. 9]ARP89524.1 hypothetical protein CAL14_03805 [Bordetella genomosp. 9]